MKSEDDITSYGEELREYTIQADKVFQDMRIAMDELADILYEMKQL